MDQIRSAGMSLADDSGASALEFALVAPMLLLLLLGMLAWGGYYWMSHCVQQLANDSARAAVGGLDVAERTRLAQASLDRQITAYGLMSPDLARLTVRETGAEMTVSVAYDASDTPFFALKGLVPMPSATISRQAATALGGY